MKDKIVKSVSRNSTQYHAVLVILRIQVIKRHRYGREFRNHQHSILGPSHHTRGSLAQRHVRPLSDVCRRVSSPTQHIHFYSESLCGIFQRAILHKCIHSMSVYYRQSEATSQLHIAKNISQKRTLLIANTIKLFARSGITRYARKLDWVICLLFSLEISSYTFLIYPIVKGENGLNTCCLILFFPDIKETQNQSCYKVIPRNFK